MQAFESDDDEPAAAPAADAEVQAAAEEEEEPAAGAAPAAFDLDARWTTLEGPLRSAMGAFLELRLNLEVSSATSLINHQSKQK